jgi:hypothetical protein
MSTWSGAVIWIVSPVSNDLNALALIRHDAGQLFELSKTVAQRVY